MPELPIARPRTSVAAIRMMTGLEKPEKVFSGGMIPVMIVATSARQATRSWRRRSHMKRTSITATITKISTCGTVTLSPCLKAGGKQTRPAAVPRGVLDRILRRWCRRADRRRFRLSRGLGDKSIRRRLDTPLQLLQEGATLHAGRDRRKELDHDGAGEAEETAARPEQSRVQRHRKARHAGFVIDIGDAGFVGGRRAGCTACAFRED